MIDLALNVIITENNFHTGPKYFDKASDPLNLQRIVEEAPHLLQIHL